MINYNCDDGDPLSEKFVNAFDRKYFIKLKIIINNTKNIGIFINKIWENKCLCVLVI